MIWRIVVYAGIVSVVVRGMVSGWDWLADWLTDWWAWLAAGVVFVGLEVTKRMLRRRRVE